MTKPEIVADCAEAQAVSTKHIEMNRNMLNYLKESYYDASWTTSAQADLELCV